MALKKQLKSLKGLGFVTQSENMPSIKRKLYDSKSEYEDIDWLFNSENI